MSDADGDEGGVANGVASGVTEKDTDVDDAQAEASVKEMMTELERQAIVGDTGISTTDLASDVGRGLSEFLTLLA